MWLMLVLISFMQQVLVPSQSGWMITCFSEFNGNTSCVTMLIVPQLTLSWPAWVNKNRVDKSGTRVNSLMTNLWMFMPKTAASLWKTYLYPLLTPHLTLSLPLPSQILTMYPPPLAFLGSQQRTPSFPLKYSTLVFGETSPVSQSNYWFQRKQNVWCALLNGDHGRCTPFLMSSNYMGNFSTPALSSQ